MKTPEDIQKELGKITEKDTQKIDSVISSLQEILKQENISEQAITDILNCKQLLDSLYVTYTNRLISVLKQHHMI